MCIYPMATVYSYEWSNYSGIWNDTSRFHEYTCRAAALYSLRENCRSVNGHAYLIFGLIGLLSAIASLIVFSREEFSHRLGYLMYRTVALLELVHMIVMIVMGLKHFLDCGSYYWCQFLSAHFSNFLLNTSAEAVDFLVLFLCIERSIACLLPTFFQKIHHRSIFLTVILIALTFSAAMNFPTIFQLTVAYSTKFARYHKPLSEFGNSKTFRTFSEINAIRLYVTGALIVLATCCSIVGLLRARSHQRRLSRRHRTRMENVCRQDGTLYEHVVEMCILQLCVAVPAVLNYVLFATMRITGLERVYLIGEEAFAQNLPYPKALEEIVCFSRYHITASAVLMTNFLAHAFHFYLYLIFCASIRHSFLDSWDRFRKSIRACKAKCDNC